VELRRLVAVAAGAVLTTALGLPSALGSDGDLPVRPVSAAPVLLAAAQPVPPPRPGVARTVETTHSYGGQARSFLLHVPDRLLDPAPLLVALHAHSQHPGSIRAYSRLEQLADEQGFVVAFPEGVGGSWNAGRCCAPGTREAVDDVAFLDEVIALSRTAAPIDPRRIALTGSSNGAMMALRYACERPQLVASVAAVAGPLVAPCTPERPVAVLALHGLLDHAVPLEGGTNDGLAVTFPAVDPSLEPFRQAGGDVRLLVVPEAGHTWMTRSGHGLDASTVVWGWVRDHPRTG
jgi:poly(3-hydroxybutyrate) depolymerase